jgi:hypothetical protein
MAINFLQSFFAIFWAEQVSQKRMYVPIFGEVIGLFGLIGMLQLLQIALCTDLSVSLCCCLKP